MEQCPDDALFWQYNPESNSIAVIASYLAGNMLSRFTDWLTTDGEKPWRNRDAEIENRFENRAELMDYWQKGWQCLMDALGAVREDQLEDIVYIRNEGHTVTEALNRQLAHYAYHVGQIVYISKMAVDGHWRSLSIPKNKSGDYNAVKFGQERKIGHFSENIQVLDQENESNEQG